MSSARRNWYVISRCSLFYFLVLSQSLVHAGVQNGTRASCVRSVVWLFDEFPETRDIDGRKFEIGLRAVGSKEFIQSSVRKSGTGVLVIRSDHRLFLVTARHVAADLGMTARLVTGEDGGQPRVIRLAALTKPNLIGWRFHQSSDIAAIELDEGSVQQQLLPKSFVEETMLIPTEPSRDLILEVLGFPFGVGAQPVFSPVSRQTRIASGRLGFANGETAFLLQDPSIQGFSGAPVFDFGNPIMQPGQMVVRSGGVTCVGFVSATISDDTGGKLAKVVPSWVAADWLKTL